MSLGVYTEFVNADSCVLVNPVPVSERYLELVKTAARNNRYGVSGPPFALSGNFDFNLKR